MLNRSQRRKMNKDGKAKLTQEQFDMLKTKVIEEEVNIQVERFIGNFVDSFRPAMREAKISEKRILDITHNLHEKAWSKYHAGEEGIKDPREDKFVDEEKFKEVLEKKLTAKGIKDSKHIALEVWTELMEGNADV